MILYKSGVGYFEHSGQVHGNEDIHIDFTTGQLNDALKSLTAVDLNGGKIGAFDRPEDVLDAIRGSAQWAEGARAFAAVSPVAELD